VRDRGAAAGRGVRAHRVTGDLHAAGVAAHGGKFHARPGGCRNRDFIADGIAHGDLGAIDLRGDVDAG
jgi:hypothetical protein